MKSYYCRRKEKRKSLTDQDMKVVMKREVIAGAEKSDNSQRLKKKIPCVRKGKGN